MRIRKLDTWQERAKADRLLETAFLHPIDPEVEKKRREESEKEEPVDDIWGLYDDDGNMTSAILTAQHEVYFEGEVCKAGEFEMVGSLPEYRNAGGIRAMTQELFADFIAQGDLFAMLIPFSFAFYRKFGFELASKGLHQKCSIQQLASFSCKHRVKQLNCAEEVNAVQALHEDFSSHYNFAEKKGPFFWNYNGNGEFGPRDFFHPDLQKYTYLFFNSSNVLEGYFTYSFVQGAEGPFRGDMEISEIIFQTPAVLRSMLGFMYRLRAKIDNVALQLPENIDLALLLPEPDSAERKLEGHFMARVLDAKGILTKLHYPQDRGSFSLHIIDDFLESVNGTYLVSYEKGHALSVEKTNLAADLIVAETTFCQLALGLIDLEEASYQEKTQIQGNVDTLNKIFMKKPVRFC